MIYISKATKTSRDVIPQEAWTVAICIKRKMQSVLITYYVKDIQLWPKIKRDFDSVIGQETVHTAYHNMC